MKLLLWLLDHFPFLACLSVGILAGTQHKPELALLFFAMGSLCEIAAGVSDLKRDVGKLAQRPSELPDPPTDTRDHPTGAHSGAQGDYGGSDACRSDIAHGGSDAGQ